MKLPFTQVDAFADRPFAGNSAAVILLDTWLDDATMQAIAAENNLAETAFLVPTSGDADYELRWFTPAVEVAMCGHATLASGHVILGLRPDLAEARFRTRKAGILRVARGGAGYTLDLPAWPATPAPLPGGVVAAIGGTPAETLWRDTGYAVLVFGSEAEVRALRPDFRALGTFGNILFIATAPGEATDIVSRAFLPGGGIDEDPVTGAAHAVVVPYWAERLGRAEFTAFQASARGGHLGCRLAGDRVVLEGACVTVIEGSFLL
jgi:predicted PhzF superfamily epimerase YddE/YHI9